MPTKPTLVQSLLNLPSQSYANADSKPKKEYYSTKQEMLRIAAAAHADPEQTHLPRGRWEEGAAAGGSDLAISATTTSTRKEPPLSAAFQPSTLAKPLFRSTGPFPEDDDDDDDLEVFFTPNTSPRTSMASSVATITFPSATRKPSRRSLTNVTAASHQPLQLPVEQKGSSSTKTPSTGPFAAVPSTRTPSTSSSRARHAISTSSTLSSTSLDGHSVFSGFVDSGESTLLTTPYQSDSANTPRAKGKSSATKVDSIANGVSPTTNGKTRGQQHADQEKLKESKKIPPSTDSPKSRTQTTTTAPKSPTSTTPATNSSPAPRAEKTSAPSSWTEHSAKTASKPQAVGKPDVVGSKTVDGGVKRSSSSASRETKGKERERDQLNEEKERERQREKKSSAAPRVSSQSQGTSTNANAPPPRAYTSSAAPPTSTATVTKTYAPPPKKQPHTFSAFASLPVPDASPSNPSPKRPTPTTSTAPANGHSVPPRPAPASSLSPSSSAPKPSQPSSSSTSTATKTPSTATATMKTEIPHHKAASSSSVTPNGHGNGNGHASSKPPATSSTSSSTSSSSSITPAPTQRKKPAVHKPPPSTMIGMDALLEEDEDGPLTPRMEARTIEPDGYTGYEWNPNWEGLSEESYGRYPMHSHSPAADGGSRMLRHTSHSRVVDHHEHDGSSSSSSSHSNSTATGRKQPKTLSDEVHALHASFATPGERPSNGTHGYSSLVLPRAPPPLSSTSGQVKPLKSSLANLVLSADGKIDLTKSGLAQGTMASVEVVRGLAGEKARAGVVGGLFGFMRRRASSGARGNGPAPLPLPHDSAANARVGGSMEGQGGGGVARWDGGSTSSPLGFTSYRAPPNYVPSGGVLVQVWAVGVDGVDGKLVGVRFGNGSVDGDGDGERVDEDDTLEGDPQQQETEDEGAEETETEDRHGGEVEETEEEEGTETETEAQHQYHSTPMTKKGGGGGFAALGRSLSLRLSRGNSSASAKQKTPPKRSASAVVAAVQTGAGASPGKSNGNGTGTVRGPSEPPQTPPSHGHGGHKRSLSFSLKRSNTAVSNASSFSPSSSASPGKSQQQQKNSLKKKKPKRMQTARPDVGYIPGRSFVGRVLECGWDVRDEVVRKGEWVVGLLDVRKGGALAEFIVVDRRRIHRVPQPNGGSGTNPIWAASSTSASSGFTQSPTLSLEELALLPLCGLSAYRAVRTFMYAFSSVRDGPSSLSTAERRGLDFVGNALNNTGMQSVSSPGVKTHRGTLPEHDVDRRRRVLVLRGHDGAGAMAVQMLAARGWKVSVHVPCSAMPADAPPEVVDYFMQITEERARMWGADEIIHDDSAVGEDGRAAAVRLIEMIREDGDVFDAVLDTVGGKEVREAGERLLRSPGGPPGPSSGAAASPMNVKRRDHGQFTTLVGDAPHRVIPTAGDNFRAGLRSLRIGGTDSTTANGTGGGGGGIGGGGGTKSSEDSGGSGKVGYAWISVAQDVDWEGVDVGETLGTVVRLALEDGIRPVVEDMDVRWKGPRSTPRAVPFEYAPNVFVDNGPLRDGGTVVVKIAE